MRRRLLALAGVVAVGAVAPAAATGWPVAATARPGVRVALPPGEGTSPVCPGPETLVAPPGGRVTAPPGPVVVAALTDGGAAQLADRDVPAAGAAPGTLSSVRTAAGPVLLGPAPHDPGFDPGSGPAGADPTGADPTGAGRARSTSAGADTPALSAVQLTVARHGDLRGTAAAACPEASTQAWLVGGGSQPGRRGRLVLADPAPTPATVDVTLLGAHGELAAPAARGVVVPASGEAALLLDALAPDQPVLAVHVQVRTGRVSAVLHDSWVRGQTPGGVDDVTPAAPPAAVQRVPGVLVTGTPPADAQAPGAVAVRVAVPGPTPVVARVRLLGAGGEITLAHPVVTVGARSVLDVPVTGVPAGLYTVVVEGDGPVVAGALVGIPATPVTPGTDPATPVPDPAAPPPGGTAVGPGAPSEFGWAPATASLDGPAVLALPGLPTDQGADRKGDRSAVLALGATGAAVQVELTQVDGRGTVLGRRTIQVPKASTRLVTLDPAATGLLLHPQAGAPAAPGAAGAPGGLVAALVLQVRDPAGPLLSVVPVRPGPPADAARPRVVADARLGLPG